MAIDGAVHQLVELAPAAVRAGTRTLSIRLGVGWGEGVAEGFKFKKSIELPFLKFFKNHKPTTNAPSPPLTFAFPYGTDTGCTLLVYPNHVGTNCLFRKPVVSEQSDSMYAASWHRVALHRLPLLLLRRGSHLPAARGRCSTLLHRGYRALLLHHRGQVLRPFLRGCEGLLQLSSGLGLGLELTGYEGWMVGVIFKN